MKVLLDTNAYGTLRAGDERVAAIVRRASRLLFSPIVAGELMAGFRAGTKFERNAAELDEFLRQRVVRLIPLGTTTADRYARVYAELRRKGKPIPTNDLWIAAQALETGATLVSHDAHFEAVGGLALAHVGG